MEGKAHYLSVGIFVALFLAGLLGFAFWLMKVGTSDSYDRYVVHFHESVAGLSADAAVKYMGVDIGTVEKLAVDPADTSAVAVYLKLDRSVPIKQDMHATLKFFGLTGLAYIEISGKDPNAPLLKPPPGKRIPVIPAAPSLYARLDEAFAQMADRLDHTLARITRLLDDENLRSFTHTMHAFEHLGTTLDSKREDIASLIDRAKALEERAQHLLTRIDTLFLGSGGGLTTEAKETMQELRRLTHRLDTTLQRGDYDLKRIFTPTTRRIDRLIDHLDAATMKLEETIEQLRQSPSDLLFKTTPPKKGPGE